MSLINKIHIEHLHICNEEKIDRILELLTSKNEAQLELILKQIKAATKDIKSTPTK